MNVLCPNRGQLREYATGKLDGAPAAAIDHHLDNCSRCRGTVDTLDEQLAPLGRWLRGTPAPTSKGGALQELAARAKALTPVQEEQYSDCSAAQFADRLARSGLLPAEELADVLADLAEPGTELAGRLVERKTLTKFQAEELLHDRGEGLVLGNYILLEPAGAGGMGRVFRAWHRRMKRVVALKLLAPELLRSEAARARFQREAEAAARLTHPHIVSAYDAAEERGRHFLVMEYVAGRTLDDLVRREGPLSIDRAVDYLAQAARGLAHAHAAGIVHRDVKPANLLLDGQGTVKVLDLGLARMDLMEAATSELTSQNVVMGTASYLAPEQATDPRRADPRADIYALGCTLHFLLTGEPPYHGATALETVLAHREQPIPSLRDRRPECPPALDHLFQSMVAKRPEDRPASLAAVLPALEPVGAGKPSRPRRWHRPALAALAASALLCWHLLPAPQPEPADHRTEPLLSAPSPKWGERQTRLPLPEVGRELGRGGLESSSLRWLKGRLAALAHVPAVEMVAIPAGQFWRGSPESDAHAQPDERPRKRITISRPFHLGKYEITQEQYQEVMGANPSAFQTSKLPKRPDTRRNPVDSVRWIEAVQFCNRLSERHGLEPYYHIKGDKVSVNDNNGYRLPTEAEWEYACRAGGDGLWSFGDDVGRLNEHAWHEGNAGGATHPVGTRKANVWGLYDMHGNVPEWCWDRYDAAYYQIAPVRDPAGSGKGTAGRVLRGGGIANAPAELRSAARTTLRAAYGVLDRAGFRVARNAEP